MNMLVLPGIVGVCLLASCNKEVSEETDVAYEKRIEESLVVDEDRCGCITEGKIRYTRNGRTVAIVDFGDGTCDNTVRIERPANGQGSCGQNNSNAMSTETRSIDCNVDFTSESVTDEERSEVSL